MHTLFYDVEHGHYHMLPPSLTQDIDEFISSFVRNSLRHLSWREIQDLNKDVGYHEDVENSKNIEMVQIDVD